jgi:hypothetical protein
MDHNILQKSSKIFGGKSSAVKRHVLCKRDSTLIGILADRRPQKIQKYRSTPQRNLVISSVTIYSNPSRGS